MEYVIVRFPGSRAVFIDDEEGGVTNEILRLEEGTHTFRLGGAQDYKPESRTLQIKGTTSVKPKEVPFEKK